MSDRIPLHRTIPKSAATAIRRAVMENRQSLADEIRRKRDLYDLLRGWAIGRELSADEWKRVRYQLTDISKAIPALAIFVLPFGGLLLIMIMKFLPPVLLPDLFRGPAPVAPPGPTRDDAI